MPIALAGVESMLLPGTAETVVILPACLWANGESRRLMGLFPLPRRLFSSPFFGSECTEQDVLATKGEVCSL